MNFYRFSLCAICLIALSGCKGNPGGGGGSFFKTSPSSLSSSDATPATPSLPASQVETAKLQEAIKAEPAYKIVDSEITTLQNEGILTEADLAQLHAIQ